MKKHNNIFLYWISWVRDFDRASLYSTVSRSQLEKPKAGSWNHLNTCPPPMYSSWCWLGLRGRNAHMRPLHVLELPQIMVTDSTGKGREGERKGGREGEKNVEKLSAPFGLHLSTLAGGTDLKAFLLWYKHCKPGCIPFLPETIPHPSSSCWIEILLRAGNWLWSSALVRRVFWCIEQQTYPPTSYYVNFSPSCEDDLTQINVIWL